MVTVVVVLGGALDLVITEVFPSLSGSVVLVLRFTSTDIARLWANGSATCGFCWGPSRYLQKQGNCRVSIKPYSSSVCLWISVLVHSSLVPAVLGSLCHLTQAGRMVMEQAFLWVWHAQLRQEGAPASGKP